MARKIFFLCAFSIGSKLFKAKKRRLKQGKIDERVPKGFKSVVYGYQENYGGLNL